MSGKSSLARLRAAAIDGRAHNIFFRAEQIEKLHKQLVQEADTIIKAIREFSGVQQSEAEFEFALALGQLREQHTKLDPEKELEDEYAPTRGKSVRERRAPVGIVILTPDSHTLFYATVAPLASAIAAGNCVAIQMPRDDQSLPSVLRRILAKALDSDAFTVVSEAPGDLKLPENALHFPRAEAQSSRAVSLGHSSPNGLVVAFVDRSANFEAAAEALVQARFAFNGQSPNAPDLVLVNEFVRKDLLQALVRQTIAYGHVVHLTGKENKSIPLDLDRYLQGEVNADVVTKTAQGAVLDLKQRSVSGCLKKRRAPVLAVHSVTSLDDGIDFLNSVTTDGPSAFYAFGALKVCKYLTQFILASASFVNSIPLGLLVGPSVAVGGSFDVDDRFPQSMFSRSAPVFICSANTNGKTSAEFTIGEACNLARQTRLASALPALVVKKRGKEFTAAFGFFEQAFLMSLAFRIILTVGVIAGIIWWYKGTSGLKP